MKKSIPDIRLNRAMISEQGDRMLLDEPVEFTKLISILYTVRRQKKGFHEVPDFDEANGGDLPPKQRAKRLGARDADVARFGEMVGSVAAHWLGLKNVWGAGQARTYIEQIKACAQDIHIIQ